MRTSRPSTVQNPYFQQSAKLVRIIDIRLTGLKFMKSSNLVQAFYTWYRNTIGNAKYRWIIILGTVAYLITPFDIAPDFIPIIGWIDDGVVATLLTAELSRLFLEWINRRQQVASTETNHGAEAETVLTVNVAAK